MAIDTDYPIVVGLAGGSGVGKTTTANGIAPMASVKLSNEGVDDINWGHLYFAMPLYSMVSAKRVTEGNMAKDRIMYAIHNILLDVFGDSPLYGAPLYGELVEMVERITNFPLPNGKPREFLQHVGTEMCRAFDPDCWVKWMDRKIRAEHARFTREIKEEASFDEDYDTVPPLAIVISDVRFPNEAEYIANHPNGILIKLHADPDIVEMRQEIRDGYAMKPEHSSHASEQMLSEIPEDYFTAMIDTSSLTIKEQVSLVQQTVLQHTGMRTYA